MHAEHLDAGDTRIRNPFLEPVGLPAEVRFHEAFLSMPGISRIRSTGLLSPAAPRP